MEGKEKDWVEPADAPDDDATSSETLADIEATEQVESASAETYADDTPARDSTGDSRDTGEPM